MNINVGKTAMIMHGLMATVLLLIECRYGWIAMGILYNGYVNTDALVALLNSLSECSWQCIRLNDIIGII